MFAAMTAPLKGGRENPFSCQKETAAVPGGTAAVR